MRELKIFLICLVFALSVIVLNIRFEFANPRIVYGLAIGVPMIVFKYWSKLND